MVVVPIIGKQLLTVFLNCLANFLQGLFILHRLVGQSEGQDGQDPLDPRTVFCAIPEGSAHNHRNDNLQHPASPVCPVQPNETRRKGPMGRHWDGAMQRALPGDLC